MKLEIGKRYRKGNGMVEEVAGITREYPDWVWTIQGNWYRQSDGRAISYGPMSGHVPWAMATSRDLIEEVELNQCDHGHETYNETRLVPTSGGDMHGNMIYCIEHYLAEMEYRRQMNTQGSADFNPFPKWEDLKIYKGDE